MQPYGEINRYALALGRCLFGADCVCAVSKNENIRKTLATALIHLYSHVNTSLVQVSVETTNTLNFTQVCVAFVLFPPVSALISELQDISHQLSETNDDLIQLQSKIPACTAWVNSFLAPAT